MRWICAEATNLVVDRLLGRREMEKSREFEELERNGGSRENRLVKKTNLIRPLFL